MGRCQFRWIVCVAFFSFFLLIWKRLFKKAANTKSNKLESHFRLAQFFFLLSADNIHLHSTINIETQLIINEMISLYLSLFSALCVARLTTDNMPYVWQRFNFDTVYFKIEISLTVYQQFMHTVESVSEKEKKRSELNFLS